MDTTLKRILELIGDKHGARSELAEYLGISPNRISDWKSGRIKSYSKYITQIAEYYGVSLDWLSGKTNVKNHDMTPTDSLSLNCIPFNAVPWIPVLGDIAAGMPIFAEENIIGYEPADGIKHPDEYFYLRVKGDSMINAGITNGSSVLIHKQNCAENGQIVACLVDGESATLKRFNQRGDTVVLTPENSKYQPIILSCNDFDVGYARILGVAIRCITIKDL